MKKHAVSKISARDRLLDTAGRLFYQSGFHAVGVDTIVAESGLTKMTLYKHFPSKDHLITAYLERYKEQFWEWIEGEIKNIPDPKEKLMAFFEGIQKKATSPQCLGCSFQSVAVEFPSSEHMAHQVTVAHKEAVMERLHQLGMKAGLGTPEQLARQLLLLMDGAWISARLYGPNNPAEDVAQAANALIESHRLILTK